MPLNPGLAQKLREHDDTQVQSGATVLENNDICDDSAPRRYRDSAWALLFLVIVAFIAATAMDPKAQLRFAENSKYMNPHIAAFVASSAVALLIMQVARIFPTSFVWAALLGGQLLAVIVGLALIPGGGALILSGVILVVGGMVGVLCTICCYKRWIPFTALIVQTVTSVVETHQGMVAVSVLGCCLTFLWWLLCTCAFVAIYLLHANRIDNFHEDVPLAGMVVIFVVTLVASWGVGVMTGACQVACCGVFGRWYFGRDLLPGAMPVLSSTRVAFTTSFGSICFGSLVMALFRAAEAVARAAREQAAEDGNVVVCIIAAIIQSILDCIGDIIEWFCTYAYVQCAIRGLGMVDAARATYALCKFANIDLIISNCLTDSVTASAAVLCGVAGGLVAFAAASGETWFLLSGFILGSFVGSACLQPLRSGAITLAVCWSEFPEALEQLRPQLHRNFNLALLPSDTRELELVEEPPSEAQQTPATAPQAVAPCFTGPVA
mmetsp:Transcript_55302/g.148136  ORF Transcript_55302/g.148136 Transcript_55302/m.148136 type:complete len:494 (-) Transcript_55302:149-1630(-)